MADHFFTYRADQSKPKLFNPLADTPLILSRTITRFSFFYTAPFDFSFSPRPSGAEPGFPRGRLPRLLSFHAPAFSLRWLFARVSSLLPPAASPRPSAAYARLALPSLPTYDGADDVVDRSSDRRRRR